MQGLKVAGKQDILDMMHLESVERGESKYATLKKVNNLLLYVDILRFKEPLMNLNFHVRNEKTNCVRFPRCFVS